MKVVIVDTIHEALEKMLTEAGYECLNLNKASDEAVTKALLTADGLVLRSRLVVNAELLDKASNLKFIGRVGAGLEHIDVAYAKSKGIAVLSSPEGNRQAVAEHALGMLLTLFNNLTKANREVRQGKWLRKANEGEELEGKTVAIIGYGNTGSAFAKVLSGFDVRVIAYDKYKTDYSSDLVAECTMDQVFHDADVVSLHLPMNKETEFLVNHQWIRQFKKPFYLINTSRGKIVNTIDMMDALDSGRMRGACLDVLEYEKKNLKMPAISELPDSALRLSQNSKTIISPHIAGLTVQSYEKLSRILAEKIIDHFGRA